MRKEGDAAEEYLNALARSIEQSGFFTLEENYQGIQQWLHAFGCRRWFNVRRDTITYRITAVYKPGDAAPGHDA